MFFITTGFDQSFLDRKKKKIGFLQGHGELNQYETKIVQSTEKFRNWCVIKIIRQNDMDIFPGFWAIENSLKTTKENDLRRPNGWN